MSDPTSRGTQKSGKFEPLTWRQLAVGALVLAVTIPALTMLYVQLVPVALEADTVRFELESGSIATQLLRSLSIPSVRIRMVRDNIETMIMAMNCGWSAPQQLRDGAISPNASSTSAVHGGRCGGGGNNARDVDPDNLFAMMDYVTFRRVTQASVAYVSARPLLLRRFPLVYSYPELRKLLTASAASTAVARQTGSRVSLLCVRLLLLQPVYYT